MAYKVYPVLENDFQDYSVKINGKEVPLDRARVSKVPFNRRWPGHQRPLDQTEEINFLSLSLSEPLKFEIIPKRKFENVVIRPLEANIKPEIKDGVISFTLYKPQYFTVEPFGRNNALHIFADPMEEKREDNNEVIYFGKGEHFVDIIHLKSNQTLYLDEGAVVYGCIRAMDAENIKIMGRGILDNSKNKERILFEVEDTPNDSAFKNAKRLHTVQLEYCTNVEIEGITVRDSLVYNIRPIACKNLTIKNVKIIGCWRYNSDGIDMHNCENVLIENCFIRTFDDSICIKGFDCYYEGDVEEAVKKAMYRNGKAYDVFKNVLVKNCVIWNDWGKCLEIGAETCADEYVNIKYKNCDLIHNESVALDINNGDRANVHNVSYENINVEYSKYENRGKIQENDDQKYEPRNEILPANLLFADMYVGVWSKDMIYGHTHDISYKNITVYMDEEVPIPLTQFRGGTPENWAENITIENLVINGKRITDLSEINYKEHEFSRNIVLK